MRIERDSTSEWYTAALGRALAGLLRPGDVVALEGGLGAGKTTLVRAITGGLRINPALVSSPTYVIVNQYGVPREAAVLGGGQLVHVDAYRLRSSEDLEPLGWDRLADPATKLAAGNSAIIVEWADRIREALPGDGELARIEITPIGPTARRIVMDLPESWREREGFEKFESREPTRCRVTGRWVSPTAPTYPFADERSREADLYQWFSGGYKTSRELGPEETPEEPRMDAEEPG